MGRGWEGKDYRGKSKILKYRYEAQKQKYRGEKKSCLSLFSALLTHDCLRSCRHNPCDVRVRSWDLGLQRVSLSRCMWVPVGVAKPKPSLKLSGPTMWALCSWCSCNNDAGASVVIISCWESSSMVQPVTKLFQNRSKDTKNNSHHSLRMRPRQDYRHAKWLC